MIATTDLLNALPDQIKTATFAHYANRSRSTILKMIREGTLPAEPLNPASKRLTYLLRKSVLLQLLGVDEQPAEPVYRSKLLAGRF
jgi:hypothetical protein